MDSFSYFHLCDHRIRKNSTDGEKATLTVSAGRDLIDVLINAAIVLEINSVRVLEYEPNDIEKNEFLYDNENREQTYDDVDPSDAYYDDREQFLVDYSKYFLTGQTISEPLPKGFYEPLLHNRIKWSVKQPKKYLVEAKVRYTHTSFQTYLSQDCPICNGKGWFVDIMDKNGVFKVATGIEKIAQRVVKDLLTEKGSQTFDLEYGKEIKKEMVRSSADEEQVFNAVRLTISEVEDQYLNDQQNVIRNLPPEEILQSLVTEQVMRHPTNPRVIIVRLRIRTMQEEQVFQVGIV
jgi:hypothetical protein